MNYKKLFFALIIMMHPCVNAKQNPQEKDLVRYVIDGNFEAARALIDKKIDVNTPSVNTNPLVSILCLQAGIAECADDVKKSRIEQMRDAHYGLVSLLLKKGANPNKKAGKDKSAALHHAVVLLPTDRRFADLLLREKADPNVQNAQGDTPLHTLLKTYKNNVQKADVNLLLHHGANPLITNNEGHTCLGLAHKFGVAGDIAQLLSDHAK